MSTTTLHAPSASSPLADVAPTPTALLARVKEAHVVAEAAQIETLLLAVEWAHAHPLRPGDKSWKPRLPEVWQPGPFDASVCGPEATFEDVEWCGIPPVRWDAPASFAAANKMTTFAGTCLIRDALILAHRLPRVWARVVAGEVPARRARQIAQTVIGAHADVVDYIDAAVVRIADKVGAARLAELLDEAMLRLYAEEREQQQLEDLDARFVEIGESSINDSGIADLYARGDWKDLSDLDHTITRIAAALKADGCTESLDVRRSMALGVLADPVAAQAMLAGQDAPAPSTKHITLFLHLTDEAILGRDLLGRNEANRRALLEQTIRDWCGRTDTHLKVQPVIDLNDHVQVSAYEIPDRLVTRIQLIHPTCVFPWCEHPARGADCDHINPYSQGGTTCSCNLAPLCRRHHRYKTHAGWRYRPLDPITDPGTYLWTDPHGFHYLRRPTGTVVAT